MPLWDVLAFALIVTCFPISFLSLEGALPFRQGNAKVTNHMRLSNLWCVLSALIMARPRWAAVRPSSLNNTEPLTHLTAPVQHLDTG